MTLLLPPPLDEELIVERGERGMVARKGDGTVVAACSQGEIDLDVPTVPGLEAGREASARFIMADDHFFPECFVCGTERADDGLCIHPGQLEASETVATDGAKEHVGTAIAGADGRILAVAAATWIVLSDEQSSFSVSRK
ncbi:MAG: hypothetical protein KJO40_11390 [Deltaproteobacteria bacterium]|nr:hypothetical protein [Deltaproteobacteria bacterium]MBT8466519.1 hypothetical protein [Deltaproteobacteria bacterium]